MGAPPAADRAGLSGVLDIFDQPQGVIDRGVGVAGRYGIADAKQLECACIIAGDGFWPASDKGVLIHGALIAAVRF